MQSLFESGRVADIVLLVMALEAIAIVTFLRPSRFNLFALIGNLVGGAALVVALRLALTGGPWPWMAIALVVSMAGHVVDLYMRERRS